MTVEMLSEGEYLIQFDDKVLGPCRYFGIMNEYVLAELARHRKKIIDDYERIIREEREGVSVI